jgi:cell division protein FtsB
MTLLLVLQNRVHELAHLRDEQKANAIRKVAVDASTLPGRKVLSVNCMDRAKSNARMVPDSGTLERHERSSVPGFRLDPKGRMKIDWEKQSGKLLHTYGRQLLVVFVVVLLVHDVFGTHGFLAMHRRQQEIQKVNVALERLNRENAALEQDVQDLKSDPQTIRKIAREELGLAEPGEIIIKLPAPEPPSPATPKP